VTPKRATWLQCGFSLRSAVPCLLHDKSNRQNATDHVVCAIALTRAFCRMVATQLCRRRGAGQLTKVIATVQRRF